MSATVQQDKRREVDFFSEHAKQGGYSAFTDASSRRVVERCATLGGFARGALVCDVGCGSGVFTDLLRQQGMRAVGLDLCEPLVAVGQKRYGVPMLVGDAEQLPFQSGSLDGLLLSGLIHHLPDSRGLAREAHRVLKPGGAFAAFDPNRRNPFMWLYRDRSSPFYSSQGVTSNERPVVASEVTQVFTEAGFLVSTDFLSVSYGYVASSAMRWALPAYNAVETWLFKPRLAKSRRAFVITYGVKPCR